MGHVDKVEVTIVEEPWKCAKAFSSDPWDVR